MRVSKRDKTVELIGRSARKGVSYIAIRHKNVYIQISRFDVTTYFNGNRYVTVGQLT